MNDDIKGAAWTCATSFGYVVNDALTKWVVQDTPLFQSIFLRGCGVTALLAFLVALGPTRPSRRFIQMRPLQLRVAMETIGTVLFLVALSNVALASLTAIMQLIPIAVTFVGARLLHEQLNGARVGAVMAGFVGVLLIIRPGSNEFSPWFLLGLATVAIVVVRELATRQLSSEVPGTVAAFYTAATITTMGLAVSLFQGWSSLNLLQAAALGGAACCLGLGYVGAINAVRVADISFTAPFRYTVLVYAIVLQILVFGDVPDIWTFAGAGIIAAAGITALRARADQTAVLTRPT